MCNVSISISRTLSSIFIILTHFKFDSDILFKSDFNEITMRAKQIFEKSNTIKTEWI